jgi:hypothetical protein
LENNPAHTRRRRRMRRTKPARRTAIVKALADFIAYPERV